MENDWAFLNIFLELELIIYVPGSWAQLNHMEPLHLDGSLLGSQSLSIRICDVTSNCTLN